MNLVIPTLSASATAKERQAIIRKFDRINTARRLKRALTSPDYHWLKPTPPRKVTPLHFQRLNFLQPGFKFLSVRNAHGHDMMDVKENNIAQSAKRH